MSLSEWLLQQQWFYKYLKTYRDGLALGCNVMARPVVALEGKRKDEITAQTKHTSTALILPCYQQLLNSVLTLVTE